jgi:uncharacterized protein (TIGR02145 family)
MQYSTTEGAQGICPENWHIPKDAEWDELVTFLGGNSVAGGKMKEAGYLHWNHPNTDATNSSKFTALPGGYSINPASSYSNIRNIGVFYSSTESSPASVWYRTLWNNNGEIQRSGVAKDYGMSVRCIMD